MAQVLFLYVVKITLLPKLLFQATDVEGDYSLLNVPLTFSPGSADGAELCVPVLAEADNLVEFEEYFVLNLTFLPLSLESQNSLSLGNTATTIHISSNEGNITKLPMISIIIIIIRTQLQLLMCLLC